MSFWQDLSGRNDNFPNFAILTRYVRSRQIVNFLCFALRHVFTRQIDKFLSFAILTSWANLANWQFAELCYFDEMKYESLLMLCK